MGQDVSREPRTSYAEVLYGLQFLRDKLQKNPSFGENATVFWQSIVGKDVPLTGQMAELEAIIAFLEERPRDYQIDRMEKEFENEREAYRLELEVQKEAYAEELAKQAIAHDSELNREKAVHQFTRDQLQRHLGLPMDFERTDASLHATLVDELNVQISNQKIEIEALTKKNKALDEQMGLLNDQINWILANNEQEVSNLENQLKQAKEEYKDTLVHFQMGDSEKDQAMAQMKNQLMESTLTLKQAKMELKSRDFALEQARKELSVQSPRMDTDCPYDELQREFNKVVFELNILRSEKDKVDLKRGLELAGLGLIQEQEEAKKMKENALKMQRMYERKESEIQAVYEKKIEEMQKSIREMEDSVLINCPAYLRMANKLLVQSKELEQEKEEKNMLFNTIEKMGKKKESDRAKYEQLVKKLEEQCTKLENVQENQDSEHQIFESLMNKSPHLMRFEEQCRKIEQEAKEKTRTQEQVEKSTENQAPISPQPTPTSSRIEEIKSHLLQMAQSTYELLNLEHQEAQTNSSKVQTLESALQARDLEIQSLQAKLDALTVKGAEPIEGAEPEGSEGSEKSWSSIDWNSEGNSSPEPEN